MNEQHQRRALLAIAAMLVMLLAGCANADAATAHPALVGAAASTAAETRSSTTTAADPATASSTASATQRPTTASATRPPTTAPRAPRADTGGDNRPGCAARAMAQGTFNPACSEYQGYLDPGTAGGRAQTSGEIQQQTLCRSGQIPKSEC